jgi:hypothetical protein
MGKRIFKISAILFVSFGVILLCEKYWLYGFIGSRSDILYSHDIWQTGGAVLFVVALLGLLLMGTYLLMATVNRIIGGKFIE